MHTVEAYLRTIMDIRRTGSAVPETSYYPALNELFNAIGRKLKPRVLCVINLANKGAGLPDGGFFTADQFSRKADPEFTPSGQVPARGVLEVKPASADVEAIARSAQVDKYFAQYRQVLVTNLWDFLLVGLDAAGNKAFLERFRLADSEADFWAKAAKPRSLAESSGDRLIEYLTRVLLLAAPLADPKDVAWMLASYAREALARTEASDLPALASIRAALEEALGMRFEGAKGEHFFRSTLVQTLFYGLFSAWVVWAKGVPPKNKYSRFDWRTASWKLHVPMISSLFEQVATPSRLGPLGLVEVLDWTAQVLNRVDRTEFFARFAEDRAVQYFYEPFLAAYDPVLRKDLGVWYTPPEIVQYMVERVDRVLRQELGLVDGLADKNVYVLDPCCGTGAFLVEVLERISRTLREKGSDALLGQDLKQAAMKRVFGFEILPAPYVVAHLQLGLALTRHGAGLKIEPAERVGVYLTNALTGWEPPQGPKQHLLLPELEAERDAADKVKQEVPILVVLGNPPYNAYAGVSPVEEQGLVEPYKEGLTSEWGIRKYNLDDLYVRFFRLAERRIAEMSGKGVVCYISNFSYLGEPSFVVMRKRLLQGFDKFWFDCLNGDSRQTGKLTPDGKPDPSIFSTEYNREGIRVGTAIGLFVKSSATEEPRVLFRQYWGTQKAQELLANLEESGVEENYQQASPHPDNRYSFRPLIAKLNYNSWPKVAELAAVQPISGLQEMRKFSLIDLSREELERRMKKYYDKECSWDEIARLRYGFTLDAGRYDAKKCREKLISTEKYKSKDVYRYSFLPLENRWAYVTPIRPLWNEPRPELLGLVSEMNRFVVTRIRAERPHENIPLIITRNLPDYHLLRPNVVAFPFYYKQKSGDQHSLFQFISDDEMMPNLSNKAIKYLDIAFNSYYSPGDACENIWYHVIAITTCSKYLQEHGDNIRADWPRTPLPKEGVLLIQSADLGKQLVALLDPDAPVPGVTSGTIPVDLRCIGAINAVAGVSLDPALGHLDVTAGWGHEGKEGVTMPGRGKAIERDYTPDERNAIEEGALKRGLNPLEAYTRLGHTTLDVWLNDVAYWGNIPVNVWGYYIGGYQVIKKWLSYREKALLGRGLSLDEARHVTDMARRLAAIRLMEPALDANYAAVKENTYDWNA